MAPRPGVKAASRLLTSIDQAISSKNEVSINGIASTCEAILNQYDDMLKIKHKDLHSLNNDCESFAEKWRNDENHAFCSYDELITVIEWKFAKGKARPMLWKKIKSNPKALVKTATESAFEKAAELNNDSSEKEIKAALEEIVTDLNGIGPASASAILSLYKPEIFAFMDDEVLEAITGGRKYTMNAYLQMNGECSRLAKALGDEWNVRSVGKALWSAARISLCDDRDDLTLQPKEEKKRQSDEGEKEGNKHREDSDESERSQRRQRRRVK